MLIFETALKLRFELANTTQLIMNRLHIMIRGKHSFSVRVNEEFLDLCLYELMFILTQGRLFTFIHHT